jgi:glycine cleavage system transcriptional repressor
MKKSMILLSVGKDRPGIVDDVSSFLFERGANIEDSRMAALGGCFSIMTLFSCNPDQAKTIKGSLHALVDLGIESYIYEADPTIEKREVGKLLKMDVRAMDHPGIVQKLVHVLRLHDVNIQSLDTHVSKAPLSGAPLFALDLEAEAPEEVSIESLKEELNGVAAQMNLDIGFEERKGNGIQ